MLFTTGTLGSEYVSGFTLESAVLGILEARALYLCGIIISCADGGLLFREIMFIGWLACTTVVGYSGKILALYLINSSFLSESLEIFDG